MFPFDLPLASAFYCTLLVVTLVLHVVFMNYVLSGAALLAFGLTRKPGSPWRQLAEILREWLPSALGVAITAGVAPLLFVQICYQQAFFTANLLAFHRWMAIVPVLIVGFYLLYLIRLAGATRPRLAVASACTALLCFSFVALSWTENTLLAGAGQEAWLEMYADSRWFHDDSLLAPRLALWVIGGIPTAAALLLLQCRGVAERTALLRPIALLAFGGMLAATVLALVNALLVEEQTRTAILGPNLPWLSLAAVAWLATGLQWIRVVLKGSASPRQAWLLLGSTVTAILATTVLREVARQQGLDLPALQPAHERAFAKGGLVVFLVFAVINGGLIAWILRLVQRRAGAPAA